MNFIAQNITNISAASKAKHQQLLPFKQVPGSKKQLTQTLYGPMMFQSLVAAGLQPEEEEKDQKGPTENLPAPDD